ncbi:TD and POZ domain-containing protein 4 isoform X4 [Parasteatoda tepidariorum]|uniref:TD and POZ domain-containing protein 4 isoform X4 n=1 Tax=Parasteatoda tepidariorum TaxID=114398 RepID=UPI001C722008|nr:protein maternal effect lethal 26 isoform X4 [Parasteatoda tepidariorum]
MGDETFGFTIYWRIENFICGPSNRFRINSEIFRIESMPSNWQVILRMNEGYLVAYLNLTNPELLIAHYSLFLLTSSGWITIFENGKKRFKAGEDSHGNVLVDFKKLTEEKWVYLPDGSLTISFRMCNEYITESSQSVMVSRLGKECNLNNRPILTFSTLKPSDMFPFPFSFELPINAATHFKIQNKKDAKIQQTQTDDTFDDLDELRSLFKKRDFSLVALRTPTREFSVLKAVLCTKSPVFKAMFERKMKENECNVVNIDDIDNQTMSLFVKFLNFEPLDELGWSTALSLYFVADKYQIGILKERCVTVLKKDVSTENVCDLLLLADLHQDDDLMKYAQEYFCQHSKVILSSTPWKDILGHTELAANVLCKLAETMH